jgi:hypothetical protein
MARPVTAADMTADIMRSRLAPTDITTTIPILARPTDITGQTGFITESSWASDRGTAGAGAAVADTGATIGAVATDTAVGMDIAAAMDIVADTDIAVAMAITVAGTTADITEAEPIPVVATTGVVDTMAVEIMAADTMAVAEAATTVAAEADITVVAVVVASTAAVGVAVVSTAVAVADTAVVVGITRPQVL